MIYTVRYAHLESAPKWKVGDKIKRGDVVGRMGNTGKSFGAHLHIDCVVGRVARRYTLDEMKDGVPTPAPWQLNLFIDRELFGGDFKITTPYADYDYQNNQKKLHCAYDIIPRGIGWDIIWNRSTEGECILVLDDPAGYGHCPYFAFTA